MPSSSSSARDHQLPVSRPLPSPAFKLSKDSWKIKKPSSQAPVASHRSPVVVYLNSPRVIHAKPQDFMSLVQRLTGNSHPPPPPPPAWLPSASSPPPMVDRGLTHRTSVNDKVFEIDFMKSLAQTQDDGAGGRKEHDLQLFTCGSQVSQVPSVPLPASTDMFLYSPNGYNFFH